MDALYSDMTLTDKVDDAVSYTKGASRLNTAAQFNDFRSQLRGEFRGLAGWLLHRRVDFHFQICKVSLRQVNEAGANIFPNQIFGRMVAAVCWDLDLEFATTKAKVHNSLAPRASSGVRAFFFGGYFSRAPPCSEKSTHAGIVFLYLVPSGDTQVNLALSYECRYIGRRKEDESDGQIFDEGYVETVFSPELDIGTFE
jgi:hypothetical protein